MFEAEFSEFERIYRNFFNYLFTKKLKTWKIEVGTRRADFVVENILTVELKAKVNLEAANLAQAKNYTKAYDFPKGLLFNFGSTSLQYKLLFNPKYNDPGFISPHKKGGESNTHKESGASNGKCKYCGK